MKFSETFPLRYYMNLGRRQDRRCEAEFQFESVELMVERFAAIDARWVKHSRGYRTKGKYACSLTKRLIIRHALLSGAESVFIFEDDIVLHPNFHQLLEQIDLPDDWGMLFLGGQHAIPPIGVSKGLVRCKHTVDNHAFGVRRPYFRQLLSALHPGPLEQTRERLSSDRQIAQLQANIPTYAAFPNLAWQSVGLSNLLDRKYSNYDIDGDQLAGARCLTGVAAEMFGGTRYSGLGNIILSHEPPENGAPRWNFQEPVHHHSDTPPPIKVAILLVSESPPAFPAAWNSWISDARDECSIYVASGETNNRELGPELNGVQIPTPGNCIGDLRIRLNLLKAALIDPNNTHFVFLPGDSVPIKPFSSLSRLLRLDPRSRILRTSLAKKRDSNPRFFVSLNGNPWIPPRCWQFHPAALLLDREAAKTLAEDDFTELFVEVERPEECYIGTVLAMKGFPFDSQTNNKEICWSLKTNFDRLTGKPHEIDGTLAAQMYVSPSFFAAGLSPDHKIEKLNLHRNEK
ncbi:glycosyltransferase family 25 protein [Haloferula chungangensis]|uniref:Glycosyltransferase family 25 protein n=1 Tax=Haloferula chungangensis TaxID=1048331 RepID=A0ABW2LAF6_9BACT